MKELNEMTLDELKALEEQVKAVKTALKESAKANKADADAVMITACNDAIKNGSLRKGVDVIVLYKGKELTATVITDPTVERTSINCNSLTFDGKVDDKGEKRRYIDKKNFVRVA